MAASVAAVVDAGVNTTFTFEFYPRVPGNAVNYTLTTTTNSTSTSTGGGSSTPSPTQTGIASDCNSYHLVVSGDTCWSISNNAEIDLDTFYELNPAVSDGCSDLWLDYYVCTGVA
jgi:LysM repeat protein